MKGSGIISVCEGGVCTSFEEKRAEFFGGKGGKGREGEGKGRDELGGGRIGGREGKERKKWKNIFLPNDPFEAAQ